MINLWWSLFRDCWDTVLLATHVQKPKLPKESNGVARCPHQGNQSGCTPDFEACTNTFPNMAAGEQHWLHGQPPSVCQPQTVELCMRTWHLYGCHVTLSCNISKNTPKPPLHAGHALLVTVAQQYMWLFTRGQRLWTILSGMCSILCLVSSLAFVICWRLLCRPKWSYEDSRKRLRSMCVSTLCWYITYVMIMCSHSCSQQLIRVKLVTWQVLYADILFLLLCSCTYFDRNVLNFACLHHVAATQRWYVISGTCMSYIFALAC